MNSRQAKHLALKKVCRWHAKDVLDRQDFMFWHDMTDQKYLGIIGEFQREARTREEGKRILWEAVVEVFEKEFKLKRRNRFGMSLGEAVELYQKTSPTVYYPGDIVDSNGDVYQCVSSGSCEGGPKNGSTAHRPADQERERLSRASGEKGFEAGGRGKAYAYSSSLRSRRP